MNNKLSILLRSNRLMVATLVLGTIFALGYTFIYLIVGDVVLPINLFINLFIVLSLFITFVSYTRHDKNVMKFTLGSTLTLVIVGWVVVASLGGFNLLTLLLILLSVGVYMIHMLINADRHSSPELVKFNQIACILYLVITIAYLIYLAVNISNYGIVVLAYVCTDLLYVCALLSCVFIETNLDTYRKAREAKGWKE